MLLNFGTRALFLVYLHLEDLSEPKHNVKPQQLQIKRICFDFFVDSI